MGHVWGESYQIGYAGKPDRTHKCIKCGMSVYAGYGADPDAVWERIGGIVCQGTRILAGENRHADARRGR